MYHRPKQPPKYCLHKSSGQAVVYLKRKAIYLGKHQSPASHEAYARIVAEWTAEVAKRQADESQIEAQPTQHFSDAIHTQPPVINRSRGCQV